jgi:CheY-like chemotaxis protein
VPQTILLVDDEYASLEVLALLLTREGYQISTASDGEEAVLRLQEKRFDLVITDYWMPRMDGLELCKRIHEDERWRGIPVLLMTAVHGFGVEDVPGLAGIIPKPMRFPSVLARVREILSEAPE